MLRDRAVSDPEKPTAVGAARYVFCGGGYTGDFGAVSNCNKKPERVAPPPLSGTRTDGVASESEDVASEPERGTVGRLRDLEQRVVALERANGELAAANEALRAANRRLAEVNRELEARGRDLEGFSYSAAHDLRSPLRIIRGFSYLLLHDHGATAHPDMIASLQRIDSAAARMGTLIDAFLTLGRTARAELRPQRVDLRDETRTIVAELRSEDPGRSLDLRVGEDLEAYGDPALIRVLMTNLLGNAWKFTRDRDQARIEFAALPPQSGERIYFVRDNGVGFDPSQRDRLFLPFARLHDADRYEGNGVGLATVERIVRRHGGRVWADGAEGAGATFYFTLPDPCAASAG